MRKTGPCGRARQEDAAERAPEPVLQAHGAEGAHVLRADAVEGPEPRWLDLGNLIPVN